MDAGLAAELSSQQQGEITALAGELNDRLVQAGSIYAERAFGLSCGLGFLPAMAVLILLLLRAIVRRLQRNRGKESQEEPRGLPPVLPPVRLLNFWLTEGSSGLTFVVDRFKGWQHSGHVTLQRGERSRLADHAAEVL